MKNIKLLFYSMLVFLNISCDNQLDVTFRNGLTPELALSDVNGYQQFLMSPYRRLFNFGYYGQTATLVPDVLADNMYIINNTGRFVSEYSNAVGAHVDIWGSVYQPINDCNYILSKVDEVRNTTNFFQVSRIKAEARFLRALCYHDLAKVYGYEPGNERNGWNKSVVNRLVPTIQPSDADKRDRATNEEIYKQIETDLLTSLKLLDTIPAGNAFKNVTPPFRVNQPAVTALLARVYLYWGKYKKADSLATRVISGLAGGTYTLQTSTAGYFSVFNNGEAAGRESIFELNIAVDDVAAGDRTNNALASMTTSFGLNVLGASQSLVDDFNSSAPTDIRVGTVISTIPLGNSSTGFPVYTISKWNGEKSQGSGVENIQIIRFPEMHLIAAEAKARLGDEAGAKANLITLRTARLGAANANVTASGSALLDLILKERRLEFFAEGHRFYDLKRFGKDIMSPTSNGSVKLLNSDYRFLARIDPFEINLNSKIIQNPGY